MYKKEVMVTNRKNAINFERGTKMKKGLTLLCAMLVAVVLSGCGSGGIESETISLDSSQISTEMVDLTGTWRQIDSDSDDTFHIAAIDEDSISVYWFTVSDNTTALYWAGTFVAPADGGAYSWESENYHDITDYALLASGDDTKKFSYDNGKLSYEVSMMGVSTTVVLKKNSNVKATVQKPNTESADNQVADGDSVLYGTMDDDTSTPVETIEEVSEQLDFKALPTMDRLVALFITNNSNTVIDELDVQLNYTDEDGNIIDVASDGHDMVLPGYTVVSRLNVPSAGFADAQLEYHIQLGTHSGYVNHAEEVEISTNPGDDCIIVQITNNSDVSIDEIEYDVVLYKGEDIVTICYPEDVYDISPGRTVTEKVSIYGKDYDRIEVYLNQAHTFNFSF